MTEVHPRRDEPLPKTAPTLLSFVGISGPRALGRTGRRAGALGAPSRARGATRMPFGRSGARLRSLLRCTRCVSIRHEGCALAGLEWREDQPLGFGNGGIDVPDHAVARRGNAQRLGAPIGGAIGAAYEPRFSNRPTTSPIVERSSAMVLHSVV